MATLTSKLIVQLIDQVTAPARGIAATLDRLNAAQERNNARLDAVRGRMVEATAVAYGLARAISSPVNAATEFETKLEDIGQKINAPVEALPRLGQQLRALGHDTMQSAEAIAEGMDVLAGMGAGRDDAIEMLRPIGRAATAYNAEIDDLAQAGYAALDNLKVPAEQFGQALDAMAQAGKAGAFELKDMAQYFPQLGAGYKALDQQGVPAVADLAAALQIVRKGTGDSASAATNLSNILQKINAPLTRKNFAAMGVNLEAEMKKAAEAGMTPIEAIAEITSRALKGNLGRLGDLFSDAQVQQGLRPLIQNIEEYRRIRAEALAAQGVVEEDYQRRLQTGALATRRWAVALEGINLVVGNALLPALTGLANVVTPILTRFEAFAERHPAIVQAVTGIAVALVGLRIAAIAAQFSLLWMRGGLISAGIMAFTALQWAVSALPAALMALANPMAIVRGAMVALRLALIGTGIGAIVVALAMAGMWIYENWSGLAAMFDAFGTAFMAAIGPLAPALQPVLDGVQWLWDLLVGLTGPIDASEAEWAGFGAAAGQAVGDVVLALAALPGQIAEWLAAGWAAVTQWFASALVEVSGFFADVVAFVTGGEGNWRNLGLVIGEAIGGAIRGIIDAAPAAFDALVTAATDGVTRTVAEIGRLASQIVAVLSGIDLFAVGRRILDSLLSGLKAAGKAVLDYAGSIGKGIRDAVSGAAGGVWQGVKNGLGFGGSGGEVEKRAEGGDVRPGQTYLVGEEGPELVRFSHAGTVIDAARTARMMSAATLAAGQAVRKPDIPMPEIRLPEVPPLPQAGRGEAASRPAANVTRVEVNGLSIQIHAAPGQSPEQVADAVIDRISSDLAAQVRGAFNDGVY